MEAGVGPRTIETRRDPAPDQKDWNLWRRWVAANVLGELVGLGTAALAGLMLGLAIEGLGGSFSGLTAFAVMVPLGTLEGVVVGEAQWRVLRKVFAGIARKRWIVATALGATVAWTLGMLPSTLMEAGDGAESGDDMALGLTLILAAGLGLLAGPVLGLPQWYVLRDHVARAWRWILANALAWAAGMPVVFLGASTAPEGLPVWQLALVIAVTVAAAGAVVGAIHGLFLMRFASERAVSGTNLAGPVMGRD